jgi:hypothetical protein
MLLRKQYLQHVAGHLLPSDVRGHDAPNREAYSVNEIGFDVRKLIFYSLKVRVFEIVPDGVHMLHFIYLGKVTKPDHAYARRKSVPRGQGRAVGSQEYGATPTASRPRPRIRVVSAWLAQVARDSPVPLRRRAVQAPPNPPRRHTVDPAAGHRCHSSA